MVSKYKMLGEGKDRFLPPVSERDSALASKHLVCLLIGNGQSALTDKYLVTGSKHLHYLTQGAECLLPSNSKYSVVGSKHLHLKRIDRFADDGREQIPLGIHLVEGLRVEGGGLRV